MDFSDLLSIVGDSPVFETGLLLAGDESPSYIRRQLSGWVSTGKVWQLRRGLYALAPPYQKTAPHPFLVANQMVSGSYVSLQSALAYYDLIPEYVPVTTSVTTLRPGDRDTPIGRFAYRHIQDSLFFGYGTAVLDNRQSALIASREKALLDLIYLQSGGDEAIYLESLRLQNLDQLEKTELRRIVEAMDKPKLYRAFTVLEELIEQEGWFETL